jgi:N-carbamoylputrescine amidase
MRERNEDRILRFALIQMSMEVSNKAKNIAKAEKLIDQAVKDFRADVVGLPELFSTEYFPQRLDPKYFDYAETIPGPTMDRMSRKAREHGIHIFAPIYEAGEPGVYYNSSALINPGGNVVGVQRRVAAGVHFAPGAGDVSYEPYYFRLGSQLSVFSIRGIKVGQLICYDRHFPEHWRILVLKGAELVFVPLASSGFVGKDESGSLYPSQMQAQAFMNQCFAASVNRVGVEGETHFYGSSLIVRPSGRFLAGPASDAEETILCTEINADEVVESRRRFSFLRDRRAELYGAICESQPLHLKE